METYGVTEDGFVLKRMDTIMEEVHEELSEGFGFDTRLSDSFLKVLVTTFCGQIADLWEEAQESYYAKFPATAEGINLDNAVQFGGIRRMPAKRSCYPLHCNGDDGTKVRAGTYVATDTTPQVRLYNPEEFTISREACNEICIRVAAVETGVYTISINSIEYSYTCDGADEDTILSALKDKIDDTDYVVTLEDGILTIKDTVKTRKNKVILSDNLTTEGVTSIANFLTESYGKITLPEGIVTVMVNNISGFTSVTNIIDPVYGRMKQSDVELRQAYIAKSALRSNTMIDSIVAELLNNVDNVLSASGYENDTNETDAYGLPPHSIEVVVEGGNPEEIAEAILKRKAGGIQTYGNVEVNVPGKYGDSIMIRFNRPSYLYTWIKVVLHGDRVLIPDNYADLTVQSIISYGESMEAGSNLLVQLLNKGIYDSVAGLTYVDIYVAYTEDKDHIPADEEYRTQNILTTMRQMVVMSDKRIEVTYDANS